MKKDRIKIIYKAPGQQPYVREVDNTLEVLQGLPVIFIGNDTQGNFTDCPCTWEEFQRVFSSLFVTTERKGWKWTIEEK